MKRNHTTSMDEGGCLFKNKGRVRLGVGCVSSKMRAEYHQASAQLLSSQELPACDASMLLGGVWTTMASVTKRDGSSSQSEITKVTRGPRGTRPRVSFSLTRFLVVSRRLPVATIMIFLRPPTMTSETTALPLNAAAAANNSRCAGRLTSAHRGSTASWRRRSMAVWTRGVLLDLGAAPHGRVAVPLGQNKQELREAGSTQRSVSRSVTRLPPWRLVHPEFLACAVDLLPELQSQRLLHPPEIQCRCLQPLAPPGRS
nr:uncharacterized protein LOC123494329 [Aegilops tauschii subsp. strangulata]